tara:strand:+ start:2542 stop:3276 length:735 start_codon:yes stop_codon:yes gene_type:complete
MNNTVLIIGAFSEVSVSIAHKFAHHGYSIQLAARNISRLQRHMSDIELRYNTDVSLHEIDILKNEDIKNFISKLNKIPDIVISVVGYMGNELSQTFDNSEASLIMKTNYEGPSLLLNEFANVFYKRKYGTIIGVSSVAGERGRAKNYLYGSAKAGFTAFLSGLRNKLFNSNVRVITVIPGYVSTPATKNLDLPPLLTAKTKEVANAMYSAINKKKDIIYVRSVWFFIMTIIKLIPEKIFKKLNL